MTEEKPTKRKWKEGTWDRPHHRNDAWQLGKALSVELYRVTAEFPDHEKFGLVSQIRRAGISIPSNIAEGKSRRTDPEFLRYLYMARGSLSEIDTQLEISEELGYLDGIDIAQSYQLFKRVRPALQRLIDSVENDISNPK